jgi:hypothetical protein
VEEVKQKLGVLDEAWSDRHNDPVVGQSAQNRTLQQNVLFVKIGAIKRFITKLLVRLTLNPRLSSSVGAS